MKKYISAEMQIIKMSANDIIATSGPGYGGSSSDNGINEAGIQGRHGLWDDDFSGENYY